MKGFQPRERIGLIVLGCIVAACFCIEPVVKTAGCSRVSEAADSIATPGLKADCIEGQGDEGSVWVRRDDRSDSHISSDSVRELRKGGKRKSKIYKHRTDSRRKTKKSSDKKSVHPSRRSLRDEKL